MDYPGNSTNESQNGISYDDASLDTYIFIVDIILATFSVLNLLLNFSLFLVCIGFIRRGCESSSDMAMRRPHYGLHVFVFNCLLSSILLECVGVLTNVGYLTTGRNILVIHIESIQIQQEVKKVVDFLTYAFFNVSHLNFVLLLNVDKLFYILRPLHYHEMMNRKRVSMVSGVTWLVGFAMASPSLMYLELNAQIRQEAILFAMCVVCPACFDLLSAIIVSTIVYKIQLRDTRTRLSIRRRSMEIIRQRTRLTQRNLKRTLITPQRSPFFYNLCSHFRVFLRAFTPILWTCLTTLPYTSTMIYLYFGTDNEQEFVRRWADITMFKVLRALGCLYVTYFTGVPFIIIFNNHTYKRRIKSLIRTISKRIPDCGKRRNLKMYSAVSASPMAGNLNRPHPSITSCAIATRPGSRGTYLCGTASYTDV